jgi:hypothetical protein
LLRIAFIGIALICSASAWSQTVVINGMVADSATMKPLGNVSLQIKNSLKGTYTNEKGYYSLSLSESDSIVFGLVGYQSKTIPVKRILNAPVVYLKELHTLLKEITFSSGFTLMGIPKIPAEKTWINPTYTTRYTNTPGIPNMQTFGPSYIYKGIFSQFNKFEKEKKRLPRLQKQNILAKNFITTVSDSVFIHDFTTLYSISKEQYLDFLKVFNEKYGNSVYKLPHDELISLLHFFYAENKKHGRTK